MTTTLPNETNKEAQTCVTCWSEFTTVVTNLHPKALTGLCK